MNGKEALRVQLEGYVPCNEQEEKDRAAMLSLLDADNVFTRENTLCHFTASSWTVNREHTKVLMVYHNIYHSWSWTGGHADGDEDLLAVAVREAGEESGIRHLVPVSNEPLSVEVLTVDGHEKRGRYVSSHLHLNVTYLLEADERDALRICPGENSGVAWFTLSEALEKCSEPWMIQRIYSKLNKKLENL